jgi:hypothetical protein
MPHVFGRSLSFSFTPIIDNEPVKVDSLVSARIFSEVPTETQIETPATTGYISAVTSWKSAGEYEKVITFNALVDADPHSNEEYETYFVVVNFKYDSGGATVHAVEQIDVFRPDGLTSTIGTTFADVYSVDPKFEDHFGVSQVDKFIADSKKDIFRWYKGLGYPKKSLLRLGELNDACRYRAAQKICLSLKWWESMSEYKAAYIDALKSSQPLAGDTSGDHAAPTPSGSVFLMR